MNERRIYRRSAAAAGALLVLAGAVSGCSASASSATTPGSPTGSTETVTVEVPPVTGSASLYLAQKLGLFQKQGLNVKLTVGQGGAAITAALQAGSIDIGESNYVSMINGIGHGLPVSLIAEGTRGTEGNFGLVVPGNSPVKSPADLKGKKIGVVSTGSVSDLTTDARLAEFGITPKDVSYVNVPLPNLVSSVASGQVDAVSVDEPLTAQAIAKGDHLVLDGYGGTNSGLATGGLFANSKWAQSHPDTVKKFVDAVYAAAKEANSNPAEVQAILPTYTSISAADAKGITLPQYATETDANKVQAVSDLMLKFDFLKAPVDISKHYAG